MHLCGCQIQLLSSNNSVPLAPFLITYNPRNFCTHNASLLGLCCVEHDPSVPYTSPLAPRADPYAHTGIEFLSPQKSKGDGAGDAEEDEHAQETYRETFGTRFIVRCDDFKLRLQANLADDGHEERLSNVSIIGVVWCEHNEICGRLMCVRLNTARDRDRYRERE